MENINISEANRWQNLIDKDQFNKYYEKWGYGYKITKVKRTDYGYIVHLFSNYITLVTAKIYVYPNNFAKVVRYVRTNYRAPYQNTSYYTDKGEIIHNENNTRKELAYFKQLIKTINHGQSRISQVLCRHYVPNIHS
jgi:hypothetical protein